MDFVLIDESNGATTTNGESMTPSALQSIAAACEVQLNRDAGAHYGGAFRVRPGSAPDDVQSNEWPFVLFGVIPNAPAGAIAFHTSSTKGWPLLFDGITLSDSLIGAGNSVAVAVSHELLETRGDEGCNVYADDGTTEYAYELCDAVEGMTYELDSSGIWVSNFVTRAFWVSHRSGPFDFMSTTAGSRVLNAPAAPFQTSPVGYQVVRDSGANPRQVTGSRIITGHAHKPRRIVHAGSRKARRGVPLHHPV